MALSQQEIELLIKLRSDAEAGLQKLGAGIRAVTGESERLAPGLDKVDAATKRVHTSSVATGVVVGNLATSIGRGLRAAFSDSIEAANRLDSGLVGLASTARAFGQDAGKAQEAARALSSDGLMTVAESAAGLKNLLAAGFGLDQAIVLMNRFKDSAAFGRQGSLEFGQAIVGATEGVKNGNSALVDNAGLTKNLSNILVEAGFSAQDLSKATSDTNIRQALFNGILKETNPQLGDTARLLETAAGKQQQFDAQVTAAQQNIGKALQPVLARLLGTLEPLVRVVGDNAEEVVELGLAATGVVGPIVAMRAITMATGVTFADVKRGAEGLAAAIRAVGSAQTVAGLSNVGGPIGTIASRLGAVRALLPIGLIFSAAAVASVYQVQRALDELQRTGDRTAAEMAILAEASRIAEQPIRDLRSAWLIVDLAQQKATKGAAILTDEQVKMREALRLTRPFVEGVGNSMAEAAERAGRAAQAIVPPQQRMASALAAFHQQIQDSIRQTGLSIPELTAKLKADEQGFAAWAKQVNLSDDAIKFLKDSIERQKKAQAEQTKASKEAEQQEKQLREELERLGVVTFPIVVERLGELATLKQKAVERGVPLLTVVRALWPEYEKLAAQAKASGVGLSRVNAEMDATARQSGFMLQPSRTFSTLALTIPAITREMQPLINRTRDQIQQQNALAAAYDRFGLQSRAELQATARASADAYRRIAADGTATPAMIRTAFLQMQEDVNAANGKIPSYWAREVVPGIARTLETLQTAVSGSFAQMILGAKGFGEGMGDVWRSIKAAAVNVFAEIADAFIKNALQRIILALTGAQGSMAGGWAGLLQSSLGVAGGAGAAGIQGTTSLASVVGTAGSGVGTIGTVGAGTSTGAMLAGGAAAAGGSFLVGGLLASRFGRGNYVGSTALGAGAGAATGAAIGSVVPGIGTGIGAGVGAIAGAIGGWLQARKLNKEADKEMEAVRTNLLQTFGSMAALREAASQVGVNIDTAFTTKGKKGVEAFTRTITDFETKFKGLQAAVDAYGITLEDLGKETPASRLSAGVDKVIADYEALGRAGVSADVRIRKMAPAFNQLLATAISTGEKLPATLVPYLGKLAEMGLLTDENVRKLAGLADASTVDFEGMQRLAQEYGIELGALGSQFQSARISAAAQQIFADFTALKESGADVGGVLLGMREEISALVNDAKKFGVAIPENMAPLVTELLRAGFLVDENGEKLTDLAGVQFGPPVKEQFELVADAISKLGDRLIEDLPEALQEVIRRLRDMIQTADLPAFQIPVDTQDPNLPGGTYPGAANGVFATTPTFRVFAEREPELGGPVSFMSKAIAGAFARGGLPSGPAGTQTINLVVDGRVLSSAVVDQIPGELKRRRLLF